MNEPTFHADTYDDKNGDERGLLFMTDSKL